MSVTARLLFVAALVCLLVPALSEERPFVHGLFSDHMVFPRDKTAPVWGWTTPGAEITVSMAGKTAKGKADKNGRWQVSLGPIPAGGPHHLSITGPNKVTFTDVLIGDVWLCSGQSNMEWGLGRSKNGDAEVAAANHPNIRLFYVPKRISLTPQQQVDATWTTCTPKTAQQFSAVGYFFGRSIHEQTGIPIGLINSNWGGTVAEAWTSAEALSTMPDFKQPLIDFANLSKKDDALDFDQVMGDWWKRNDPGSANGLGFADPTYDCSTWKTMDLPGSWEGKGLPGFDGIVWFRFDLDIPPDWIGHNAELELGPIDDQDTTWINGSKIGETTGWARPRSYKVPKKLLSAGRNTITIRILDTGGGGGLYGKPEQLRLLRADKQSLPLSGTWYYKVTRKFEDLPPPPQRIDNNQNAVTVLSNGMIACLEPFAITGAIWYQGESNTKYPEQYRRLLPTMISDWRKRFGVGDFPFYIVQLANHMAPTDQPVQSGWAELREAQLWTATHVKNCGLAVITDIGDEKDIHPRNKQDVGKRLALTALANTYGKNIVHQGPLYKKMSVEGSSIRLHFDHVGSGLICKNERLAGFAIAGADGNFVHADAHIDGDTIIVSAATISEPKAVRYGWANNPPATLFNKEGLPASPFRTDGPR